MDNKNKNPNVPNLRFNDHDTWIENSLQNVTSYFKSGKNINAKMILEEGLYPVYGGNGIRGFTNTYNQDGKYILVGRQGALCGNVRLVEGKSYVTEHGIIIINNNQSTIEYLKPLLEHMHLEKESDQSAQPGLAVNKLLLLKQYFPSIENQERIGKLFTLLEMKIQLQNKIIEEYELLKNTINSHLIGNETPNIKISECMDCLSSSKKESDIINAPEGDYPAFGANGLIRKINTYDYQRPGISIVKDGAGVGRMSYLTGKYSIVGTQNLLINKSNYNLVYLYYALQNLDFRKYVVGSGIPHIYFKDYKNEYIYLPDNKKMINIISKCLSSIDVKISIENEVLDKLLKQKEYLLSNMFI